MEVLRSTVTGYSTVTPQNVNVQTSNTQVHYAMLPVWILNTSWKGKNYKFAMNGQTGRFVGNLPCDSLKFWKWFAIYGSIAATIGYLVIHFILNG